MIGDQSISIRLIVPMGGYLIFDNESSITNKANALTIQPKLRAYRMIHTAY